MRAGHMREGGTTEQNYGLDALPGLALSTPIAIASISYLANHCSLADSVLQGTHICGDNAGSQLSLILRQECIGQAPPDGAAPFAVKFMQSVLLHAGEEMPCPLQL